MREIVFKAKRVDDGEWVDGDLVSYEDAAIIRAKGWHIGTGWHVVDPDTVCQYTGLRDKDGERIFEGDIVTVYTLKKSPEHGEKAVIEFYSNGWCIYMSRFYPLCRKGWTVNINSEMSFDVIGNIYDTK